MDESGFTYGRVVRNSGAPDFVVMVLHRVADWVYPVNPSITHPQAMAVVLHTFGHTHRVGQVIKITGDVKPGEWEVVA